jgi:hypothetical protein
LSRGRVLCILFVTMPRGSAIRWPASPDNGHAGCLRSLCHPCRRM